MDRRAFDNIKISSIPRLLDEQVILKRYYPLIPYRDRIVAVLGSLGIRDKYQYLDAPQEIQEAFIREIEFDAATASLFMGFLHLYDFKERRIFDVGEIEDFSAEKLDTTVIRTSGQYLQYCVDYGIEAAAKELNTDADSARVLSCLCDLMRLPGVKWLRAKLYYDCGFHSVQALAQQDAKQMRNEIAAYIQTNHIQRAVPLQKEISTQIAVADALVCGSHFVFAHKIT